MTQLRDSVAEDKPYPMERLRPRICTRAVSVLCALALALVAFAHRPVESDPRRADPQIAAYLASGGTLGDLCMAGDPEGDRPSHADCPACIIAKSVAMAPACPVPLGLVSWSSRRAAWPDTLVLTGHAPRAPPARGPPSIPLI